MFVSDTVLSESLHQETPQLIDGKPYFGVWMGHSIIFYEYVFDMKDKFIDMLHHNSVQVLQNVLPEGCLINESIIYGSPMHASTMMGYSPIMQHATVAKKYLLWGRAYKVMRVLKKGVKRYKKCIVNGKRKRIRYG